MSSRDRKQNQSEKVFVAKIREGESMARRANVIYRGMRRAFLTIGTALAVMLPLTLLPSPDVIDGKEKGDVPDNTTINYYQVQTNAKDGQDGKDGKDGKDGIDGKDGNDGKDVVTGSGGGDVSIRGVPPLTREWHRSVFKEGDKLWALPSVAFKLELTSLTGSGCLDKGKDCLAFFKLEAPAYIGPDLNNAFQIGMYGGAASEIRTPTCEHVSEDRCIGFNKGFWDQPLEANACKVNRDPLTPEVLCQFFNTDLAQDDVCLWMRRSEVPENSAQLTKNHVAVDIKWKMMELHANGSRTQPECDDWRNISVE